MRIVDYLAQNAIRYPDKIAVVCGDLSYTYAQLWQEVVDQKDRLLDSRQNHEPLPLIHCFRSSQDIHFLVTYLATHLAGSVAAPLEKGMPESLFQEVKARLQASDVPDGIADILYTTGTTGQSKGVMISHQAMIADAENLIAGQGFTHDLIFVAHGPLNHIGSLSKIWPVIILGATLHILDGLKDAGAFFDAFRQEGRYATFFVPANIRYLLAFDAKRFAALADRLDFVESGGAPLSHADMLHLCQLLPHTRLYNTYASTETGIIATYNYNDGRCLAGCLGRPMPHSRVMITDEGKIACQGDTLMSGYLGDEALTAGILHDGTVYMSDYGRIDSDGMLHILGRENDVINVGGYKVAPTEVEDVTMSFSGVTDCICIAADHPVMGLALKLLVVMAAGTSLDKRSLARHLAARLEPYKVPILYEQVASVARTYNGKLDRKHYML